MPRKKEPIDLIIAKGASHLTKAQIESRRQSELSAPCGNVVAPSFLTAKEKKRFNELAEQLSKIGNGGIIADIDAGALARYVEAESMYEKLTRKLRKEMQAKTFSDNIAAMLTAQDKLFKQCRAAASDLGLCITSRCRIVIPKVSDAEKSANRFSKFDKSRVG